jgi:hypothetical protein
MRGTTRTRSTRLPRPSAATVIACLALFVALGGAAYAGLKVPKNSVRTKSIQNGAVTNPKLADGAVNGSKLASGAVSMGKIADGAITGPKLGANSIDASKIINGSVGKAKLAAAGLATNNNSVNLAPGACSVVVFFNATGVQPGDVVMFNLAETGASISASSANNTVPAANTLDIALCNIGATSVNLAGGSVAIGYVAIR